MSKTIDLTEAFTKFLVPIYQNPDVPVKNIQVETFLHDIGGISTLFTLLSSQDVDSEFSTYLRMACNAVFSNIIGHRELYRKENTSHLQDIFFTASILDVMAILNAFIQATSLSNTDTGLTSDEMVISDDLFSTLFYLLRFKHTGIAELAANVILSQKIKNQDIEDVNTTYIINTSFDSIKYDGIYRIFSPKYINLLFSGSLRVPLSVYENENKFKAQLSSYLTLECTPEEIQDNIQAQSIINGTKDGISAILDKRYALTRLPLSINAVLQDAINPSDTPTRTSCNGLISKSNDEIFYSPINPSLHHVDSLTLRSRFFSLASKTITKMQDSADATSSGNLLFASVISIYEEVVYPIILSDVFALNISKIMQVDAVVESGSLSNDAYFVDAMSRTTSLSILSEITTSSEYGLLLCQKYRLFDIITIILATFIHQHLHPSTVIASQSSLCMSSEINQWTWLTKATTTGFFSYTDIYPFLEQDSEYSGTNSRTANSSSFNLVSYYLQFIASTVKHYSTILQAREKVENMKTNENTTNEDMRSTSNISSSSLSHPYSIFDASRNLTSASACVSVSLDIGLRIIHAIVPDSIYTYLTTIIQNYITGELNSSLTYLLPSVYSVLLQHTQHREYALDSLRIQFENNITMIKFYSIPHLASNSQIVSQPVSQLASQYDSIDSVENSILSHILRYCITNQDDSLQSCAYFTFQAFYRAKQQFGIEILHTIYFQLLSNFSVNDYESVTPTEQQQIGLDGPFLSFLTKRNVIGYIAKNICMLTQFCLFGQKDRFNQHNFEQKFPEFSRMISFDDCKYVKRIVSMIPYSLSNTSSNDPNYDLIITHNSRIQTRIDSVISMLCDRGSSILEDKAVTTHIFLYTLSLHSWFIKACIEHPSFDLWISTMIETATTQTNQACFEWRKKIALNIIHSRYFTTSSIGNVNVAKNGTSNDGNDNEVLTIATITRNRFILVANAFTIAELQRNTMIEPVSMVAQ